MWPTRPGARAAAYSSAQTTCWVRVARRLPKSPCQPMPIQPPLPSSRSQARRSSAPSCSLPGPPVAPAVANSPVKCSASQSRASARNAASSGPGRNPRRASPA